eukprot:3787259-Pleurochrysis_carterae.AAC.1
MARMGMGKMRRAWGGGREEGNGPGKERNVLIVIRGGFTWLSCRQAAHRALDYVMKYVQDAGLVSLVTSKQSGRATDTYLIRNRYYLGVEFSKTRPKPSRPTKRKLREPEEEEELADIEIERKRNMERNRQLLMQLGLA